MNPRGHENEPVSRAGRSSGLDEVRALARIAPAQAQTYDPNYPVCLQVYDDMVNFYFECGYTSMAQCAASASGRYAQCVVNPYYAGPNAGRGARKKRAR